MAGRWKLSYTTENTLGAIAFGGQMLEPYQNPYTKEMMFPLDEQNKPMPGFWVDKLVAYFVPDKLENNEHYNAVAFLLGHPEVMIEGLTIDDQYARFKKSNTKMKLINLDHQDQLELDDQEIIDSMIGRLTLDAGVHAVSLEKLQYVLAKLNKPFLDKRYITDNQQLKKQLRKAVKDYARKGAKECLEIENILDNIENAKKTFLIKYLVELGVLVFSAGSFKHDGLVIGFNVESAVDYLSLNPEHYLSLQEILDKKLRESDK